MMFDVQQDQTAARSGDKFAFICSTRHCWVYAPRMGRFVLQVPIGSFCFESMKLGAYITDGWPRRAQIHK
jgi:hypothetical protein